MENSTSNAPGNRKEIVIGGFTSARTKTRIDVLLNIMPEYHRTYVESGDDNTAVINSADLIIGAGVVARDGILGRKPTIIAGDYGLGGLVTPATLLDFYEVKGKVQGKKEEYFSLERLEIEIKKSSEVTSQDIQMMSIRMVTYLHNRLS